MRKTIPGLFEHKTRVWRSFAHSLIPCGFSRLMITGENTKSAWSHTASWAPEGCRSHSPGFSHWHTAGDSLLVRPAVSAIIPPWVLADEWQQPPAGAGTPRPGNQHGDDHHGAVQQSHGAVHAHEAHADTIQPAARDVHVGPHEQHRDDHESHPVPMRPSAQSAPTATSRAMVDDVRDPAATTKRPALAHRDGTECRPFRRSKSDVEDRVDDVEAPDPEPDGEEQQPRPAPR